MLVIQETYSRRKTIAKDYSLFLRSPPAKYFEGCQLAFVFKREIESKQVTDNDGRGPMKIATYKTKYLHLEENGNTS